MKKKLIAAVICGAFCVTALCMALGGINSSKQVVSNYTTIPKIIIDAGHGGIDGGAVGVDGVTEKGINLSISLKLRELLLSSGYEVIMTRTEDISIHDDSAKTIRQQKVSDLNNRLKIAANNPDAILISIHQNKFGSQKVKGSQMYYGIKNDVSSELAEILRGKFNKFVHSEGSRPVKAAGKNLFLMYNSPIPSVLVECGFLSNPDEAGLLPTDEYQDKIAFVIFNSILEFVDLVV